MPDYAKVALVIGAALRSVRSPRSTSLASITIKDQCPSPLEYEDQLLQKR